MHRPVGGREGREVGRLGGCLSTYYLPVYTYLGSYLGI